MRKIEKTLPAGKPEPERRVSDRALLFLAALAAALLLLTALGLWTHDAVRAGLEHQLAAELERVLNANIAGLEIWIEDEKSDVEIWARNAAVRRSVAELKNIAAGAAGTAGPLRNAPQQAELGQTLAAPVTDLDYRGFALIDSTGLILASDRQRYIGRAISAAMASELGRVLTGETLFIRPLPKDVLVRDGGVGELPVILVAAPVRDFRQRVTAVLVFTIDPEQNFSRILSAARAGASGDTYAFDARGFLLSETRHESQLEALGLIPAAPERRSVLSVQIRDPGGDLTQRFQGAEPLETRPLTRMAASAVTGRSGVDLSGYRDYRGVKVIGAWRWLPEYRFGIATEWEYREALQALQPIRLAFWVLAGAVATLGFGLLASSWWIRRLRRRLGAISQLGQYTLVEKIGEGGMGHVYRARHALLRRPTAIKLIRQDAVDAMTLARFEREVQLTSELTHPNTISIFDYGHTPEGIFYYAMEYLPGISLQQLVKLEGALPPARMVHILAQVCASLREAHGRGMVHRDINPKNIILGERGGIYDFAKLLDFGLVKDLTGRLSAADATAARDVYGTPGFVAPERLTAPQTAGIAADLYSVGAVGFFLLTGETVFAGEFSFDLYTQAVRTPPRRPAERAPRPLPAELDDLIFACLQRDPAARPGSAEEIDRRLKRIACAGDWSETDARRWWQENAGRIEEMQRIGRSTLSSLVPGEPPVGAVIKKRVTG